MVPKASTTFLYDAKKTRAETHAFSLRSLLFSERNVDFRHRNVHTDGRGSRIDNQGYTDGVGGIYHQA